MMNTLSIPEWDELVDQLRLIAAWRKGCENFRSEFRAADFTGVYEERFQAATDDEEPQSDDELADLNRLQWLIVDAELEFCGLAVTEADPLLDEIHDVLVELSHIYGCGQRKIDPAPGERCRYTHGSLSTTVIMTSDDHHNRFLRLETLAGQMRGRARRELRRKTKKPDPIKPPSKEEFRRVDQAIEALGKGATQRDILTWIKDKYGHAFRPEKLTAIIEELTERGKY